MTKQRLLIYDVVFDSADHPDAVSICRRARKVMPRISLATVYRNLNALVKDGYILRLDGEGSSRYDRGDIPHGHLRCGSCGIIQDSPAIELKRHIEETVGQAILRYDLNVYNLCKICGG